MTEGFNKYNVKLEEVFMERNFNYDDVPVVETQSGLLKGYSMDHVYIFKGIPYAQAKRFHMPEPVTPWEGVRDATSYGFVCHLLNQETPNGELLVPHRYWPQSEHCQNLNIWTKSLEKGVKRPVIIWLHGGGYTAGSSIEQVAYDGYNMCDEADLVVVSVNHRLNILGYLDLSAYGEEYANSANAGHADLVAALQWVHDNIEAFGGDPDNVTIFGQSGGGMKVTDLMQIPAADGLFQKGFVMSGVTKPGFMPPQKGDGHTIVEALLQELGLEAGNARLLENVPYYELAQAYNKISPALAMQGIYVGGGPKINDYYMGNPLEIGFRDHAYEIPLLVGSVFGEFSFRPQNFDKASLTDEEALALVEQAYKGHGKEIMEKFAAAYPDKYSVDAMNIDRVMRGASKALTALHAKGHKAPVWLYNFTLEFPYQHGKIAWHCADIPFVFNNTDKVEICNIPGVSQKLEKQIFGAVAAFAEKGDPNHEGLPQWTPVTETDEPTMIFDRTCQVRHNYDDDLLQYMDEVLPPFSMADLFGQDVQH